MTWAGGSELPDKHQGQMAQEEGTPHLVILWPLGSTAHAEHIKGGHYIGEKVLDSSTCRLGGLLMERMGTGVLGLAGLEQQERKRRTMISGLKAASRSNYQD